VTAGGHSETMPSQGLRLMPRPLFVFAVVVATLCARAATAQDPVRPWLRWRTVETPGYRFHYLPELEPWTRDVAARVEQVDSAIGAIVGYSTTKPVHVVVDDPFAIANGYALPFADRPVSVWWASPPDPRNDIGNFGSWGEMLAVHELTHLAHLTRPSRNPLQRRLWESLTANLGPVARKSPRWVFEGYATYVEGRITGTGRPNNTWRPAILRQWAIEGRLPSYGQLSTSGEFNGAEFAYLEGSAFLDWLARRAGGDAALVNVWRRMTARRVRTFEGSFQGVFGDHPAVLYGRHVAELTRDAMAAKAELERAGLVEGELVQHLSWATGDPAISPAGDRVALVLRDRDRPARVVVWKTATEPEDTTAIRRRIAMLTRDPLDVPDRRFYPAPKRVEHSLPATNGRSYQMPRWFGDGRRLLLTRWTQRVDGTLSPALYVWDTEDGTVRRVTAPAGLMHADPHPTRDEAVAMQCRGGRCDIVWVDLRRGTMRTVLQGNERLSYYRPRWSPDGTRFAAARATGGVWDLVVGTLDGSAPQRVGASNDSANRYDVQWMGNDSLVAVSERGGVANLFVSAVPDATGGVRNADPESRLTRVTGAAVAPEVNRADGSIWFLSLHAGGYDLRRIPRGAPRADSIVTIDAARFGYAGAGPMSLRTIAARPLAPSRPYGAGPRHARWIPGGFVSADGVGGTLTLFGGDIVGRLNGVLAGVLGEVGTWQGGALRLTWRYPRPAIELGVHGLIHEPSRGRDPAPGVAAIDATVTHAVLAAVSERRGEGWFWRVRAGASAGSLTQPAVPMVPRSLAFAEATFRLSQSRGARGLMERLWVHGTEGRSGTTFQRTVGTFALETTGRDAIPFAASVTYGHVSGAASPFEQFSVGGLQSPVGDSAVLSQRYAMPSLPTGTAIGRELLAWRVALPSSWTLFYEGAAATDNVYSVHKWNRAVGAEMRFALPPIPPAFSPRLDARGGVAFTLDAPFRRHVRVYLEMLVQP
jgi:Tol biopolymer transport system component